MAPVALKKLVVLEDGVLSGLAHHAGLLREFPFLASLARAGQTKGQRGGCGSCGGGQVAQQRATVYAAARTAIAGLDSAKKRRFKEILGTEQIRIFYNGGAGKVIKLTF